MASTAEELERIAGETGFSGAVRVERGGVVEFEGAFGLAHRGYGVPNTVGTRFAVASGTKGLTAVAVLALVQDGVLELGTTARSVLGGDLPLIDDAVTVEQLLGHRSGIGDYYGEDDNHVITDYVLPVPVHELAETEQFLAVLGGLPQESAPGERFVYNNGGYVVLALIAERAGGVDFHDLVRTRVCEPAGMADTEFLRSDELPGRAALGYLPLDGGARSNVFHLPVRGTGDGGIYSTVADFGAFWAALFGGKILSPDSVAELVRARSDDPDSGRGYGLGFWLHRDGRVVQLEGYDPGVSFRSTHDTDSGLTCTVVSNTTDGTWPVTRRLEAELFGVKPA
ncbi:serine hydrolase domain-containing protein [Amycolatopsis sp. H20-H5]|uniref:serine hydrolase domain-containing protein n=1 Tax=Amycolatopsis sp. H20-H5 TaxID=3046309 RepID=UPI002DB80B79|nr:serine hydrolase domain-containing protein [Amycolatopsis sp. H20-H5]MEC3978947.1 serine hydrolase domain-containing protein [Amycolatopsis sp. H20-H5]